MDDRGKTPLTQPSILSRAEGIAGRIADSAAEQIGAERDRLALWLPVAFGGGIGIYFGLAHEPALWTGPAIAVLAVLGLLLSRRNPLLVLPLGAAVAVGLGLSAAQWRSYGQSAPVIDARIGPVEVQGRVVAVELRPEGRRITLDRLQIPGLKAAQTPEQVRILVRRPGDPLAPADLVAVKAILLPPPAPAAPGAYDFQREAWFARLGGVGFATGEMHRTGRAAPAFDEWLLWLNAARLAVVERTLAVLPGASGAITAALLTGEQGAIPQDVMAAMRDSGLAHLLSISGLHVSLVAAIVFFLLRGSLALIPYVALRHPIKKWAAFAALIAITLYMLFTSPGVPTQRSWLMTGVVLVAIMIDRTAISMRLIAWAALVVLAIKPESLLGPSFQMSFAAVVALIAAWEALRSRFVAWRSGGGWLRRCWVHLAAMCLTTIVAGFASAPFALYHFNRFTLYGLAANFIAVPLTSIWVMPWAVIAYPLFLFGWEAFALVPMGWGVDVILEVARLVAGWDGAVALFPAMPTWGLVLATLGGLWVCLWQTRWRWLGVPAFAVGLLSIVTIQPPDVLVSGDAKLIAVRDTHGLLQLSSSRAARLTRETWLRRAGQDEAVSWPISGADADGRLLCDPQGCVYRANGQVVAFVRDPAALLEDCQHASVVVATIPIRRTCASAQVVVDRFSLWRDGGHALWLNAHTVKVKSVREERGQRPWVPGLPLSRRERALRSGG